MVGRGEIPSGSQRVRMKCSLDLLAVGENALIDRDGLAHASGLAVSEG